MEHDLLIIGGGASGIMAAITAKDNGADVAIVESNDRIGKKLLITGNGRCNITNENIQMNRYHSKNKNFYIPCLEAFTQEQTTDFFLNLGLPLISLDDGKKFPMSLQASSLLDIFRLALEERNIPMYTNCRVKEIKKIKNKFVINAQDNINYQCRKLILATGGKSAPNTGSDGFGISAARNLGHKVITTVPALVQLKLNYKNLKALSGIKFDGFCEIIVDGHSERKEFGELLFTDYGVSGPPILQLSRIAAYAIEMRKHTIIRIDILPNVSKEALKTFLDNHFGMFSYRSVHDSLIGIINKKLIPIILKQCGIINIHKPCYDLQWDEKSRLLDILKSWCFEVVGTNSFSNSQVTAGGVDTTEVNNLSLESKLIPDLYFCGEILDVDGDCGGFNLQWAWSSGFVAGSSAAHTN